MRTRNRRYKKAIIIESDNEMLDGQFVVPMGHSVCVAGYIDCDDPDLQHYHCGNCGGITGHQGHYSKLPGQTEWQFNCPEEDK